VGSQSSDDTQMTEKKTSLTFEETIIAAYMYFVREVTQQDIAAMMGGVNMARVNDACKAIKYGADNVALIVAKSRNKGESNGVHHQVHEEERAKQAN
jgi:hypothetical protein